MAGFFLFSDLRVAHLKRLGITENGIITTFQDLFLAASSRGFASQPRGGWHNFAAILLFFRARPVTMKFRDEVLPPPAKLFTQVITSSLPEIRKIWEQGDRYLGNEGINCPKEFAFDAGVGRSFYQCQPHFWQCYWEGKIVGNPLIKIEMFGQTFHVSAKASFEAIPFYSDEPRLISHCRIASADYYDESEPKRRKRQAQSNQ